METQPGGTPFDLGNTSTLQQDSLAQIPTDSPYQDLNGEPGPQFDLGPNSLIQKKFFIKYPYKFPLPGLKR